MAVFRSSAPSIETLLGLVEGHRVSAAIHAAARLGIADSLFESPKTIAELARATDVHERSLLRLMRALVKVGVCIEGSGGRFELTKTGSHLAANSEASLKAYALVEGGVLRAAWGELAESIRTGKTRTELDGRELNQHFGMMAASTRGEFDEAMLSLTRMAVPDLLAACDFSGISTVMDVGGGTGQLISAILEVHSALRGIVFDLPHCESGAKKNFAEAGVADRGEFVAGSFFEAVPQIADAIIMKSILHDWDDERCDRILKNCRHVLKPGARLIVIEKVLPEKLEPGRTDLAVYLDDLNMLRGPGGCERTPSEFRTLLAKGGFTMGRLIPTGRYHVIEASAV